MFFVYQVENFLFSYVCGLVVAGNISCWHSKRTESPGSTAVQKSSTAVQRVALLSKEWHCCPKVALLSKK